MTNFDPDWASEEEWRDELNRLNQQVRMDQLESHRRTKIWNLLCGITIVCILVWIVS